MGDTLIPGDWQGGMFRCLPLLCAPNGKTAYVANIGYNGRGHTVTPIRTVTDKPGQAINVGRFPDYIAITPNGKTAYVASRSGVTPFLTATDKIGKAIKVGSCPCTIAITP